MTLSILHRPALAALLVAAVTAATPVVAETTPAVLTYALFEETVPHVDLAACPAEFDADDVFCRGVLTHADMHVFVFAYEGDSPFVAARVYPAEGLEALYD
jgi:hypothetical protein